MGEQDCLWVRDALYRARAFGRGLGVDPETARCKPDGLIVCRPCGERFGLWPSSVETGA